MTATDRDRIQGLLAEGWRLLEAGDPREAALVFGRVALVEPASPEALRGLASARAAITESERRNDERLHEAQRAPRRATAGRARGPGGGDRGRRRSRPCREPARSARRARRTPRSRRGAARGAGAQPVARASAVSWSRRAFAAAATIVLVVLGAGVFSSWDRLLFGLTRPPSPRSDQAAAWPAPPTGGERALAEARRLLDAGDAARARWSPLDRVGPQEPSYPFARQLRQQAERALHAEPSGVPRAGRP